MRCRSSGALENLRLNNLTVRVVLVLMVSGPEHIKAPA